MIIFGVSVFYLFGLIGTGHFACPNCGGDREYQHRVARRFFTLFFLPVIPLDKVGEIVQCQTCRVRFDPVVLRRPTNADLATAITAGMRAAATAVLRAGSVSDPAVRAAIEAVRAAGEPGYDVERLHADLRLPTDAAVEPLRTVAAQLTPEAREPYFAGVVRIGLADGPLTPTERDALQWIASHLGMTPAHAQGVIWTVERSVTPG